MGRPKKEVEKENDKLEEKKALVATEEINEEKLEKIEEEIKNQTTITDKKQNKINRRIFQNLLVATSILLYFIAINMGFKSIDRLTYFRDLQVFSMVTIVITILIFERAYKHDSGEIAIYGIEMLVVSICTLLTIYIDINLPNKYVSIVNLIAILFAVYYVGKSIYIYKKMKRNALKKANNMYKDIAK